MTAVRGKFITLEGGEGAGKSTQSKLLSASLRDYGFEVLQTREPGGCSDAETIRTLLVSGGTDRWSPLSEALMMSAARVEHIRKTIRPALLRGAWVVCDRYTDSTSVYQGYAGGVDLTFLALLNDRVCEDIVPDLTLVLDLPPEVGLSRTFARSANESRFENKGLSYHQKISDGFKRIAESDPKRCIIIDGQGKVEETHDKLLQVVVSRFELGALHVNA